MPPGFEPLAAGLVGSFGQLDRTDDQSANYDSDLVDAQGPSVMYLRCYGGGQIKILINDVLRGRVSCDATTGVVAVPSTDKSRMISLVGDSVQVFAFTLQRATVGP